jgi:hypothetical protein
VIKHNLFLPVLVAMTSRVDERLGLPLQISVRTFFLTFLSLQQQSYFLVVAQAASLSPMTQSSALIQSDGPPQALEEQECYASPAYDVQQILALFEGSLNFEWQLASSLQLD